MTASSLIVCDARKQRAGTAVEGRTNGLLLAATRLAVRTLCQLTQLGVKLDVARFTHSMGSVGQLASSSIVSGDKSLISV